MQICKAHNKKILKETKQNIDKIEKYTRKKQSLC